MGLRLTTPPSSIPLTLTQLRKQCEIAEDDTTHDAQLSQHAAAATEFFERHTRRALVTQTFTFTTAWSELIELPRPPLVSVATVKTIDVDNVATTVDAADYTVLTNGLPGVVRFDTGFQYTGQLREYEPVEIVFTAGYGTPVSVPETAKTWILQMVGFWFEIGRGDVQTKVPEHMTEALRGMGTGMKYGFFSGRV